jgi:hypothetical protein
MGAQSERIGAQLRKEIETACKALVLEINRELRKATPVDTGNARAHWVPSVGSPFAGAADGASYQQGVATVLSFKLGDGVLYVSNNVPYIRRLNEGHSRQAPALFIEAAVDRAFAKVEAKYQGRIKLGRAQFVSAGGAESAQNLAEAYSPFAD